METVCGNYRNTNGNTAACANIYSPKYTILYYKYKYTTIIQ